MAWEIMSLLSRLSCLQYDLCIPPAIHLATSQNQHKLNLELEVCFFSCNYWKICSWMCFCGTTFVFTQQCQKRKVEQVKSNPASQKPLNYVNSLNLRLPGACNRYQTYLLLSIACQSILMCQWHSRYSTVIVNKQIIMLSLLQIRSFSFLHSLSLLDIRHAFIKTPKAVSGPRSVF